MSDLWSVALRATLSGFESLGVDRLEVCRRAGIDPAVLADADARVPLELTSRIWAIGEELSGQPAIGLHAGAAIPFGELEGLDYIIATAPTVEAAVRSLVDYFRVVTAGVTQFTLPPRAPGAGQRLVFAGLVPAQLRDYAVAASGQRLRNIGARIEAVELEGPPLADADTYRTVLAVPEVRFHAAETAQLLAAESLAQPVASDYPGLRSLLVREMDRLIERLPDDELAGARAALASALAQGTPRIEEIAARLHVSVRTLQRRLGEAGLSFSELLAQTRAELARAHLESTRLSIAEIGYLLGYAEASSFTRAFSRWFDCTPADYRARHAAGAR